MPRLGRRMVPANHVLELLGKITRLEQRTACLAVVVPDDGALGNHERLALRPAPQERGSRHIGP